MQSNPTPGFAFRPVASVAAARLIQRPVELRRPSAPLTARMAIKDQGRIRFIDPGEVFAIVAQGNYVLLQRETGSHCVREPISVMAERLQPYGFVRVHRSALVNRSWVEEMSPGFAGEYLLLLRGGRAFKVTRTYRKNLTALAELWLGNDSGI